MNFLEEQIGRILILQPTHSGRGEFSGLPKLKNEVIRRVENGQIHILVDMSQVDFLGSMEIGALVGCLRLLESRKGTFALCCVGPHLFEALCMVRLETIIPIRISRDEALNDLKPKMHDSNRIRRLVQGNPKLEEIQSRWRQQALETEAEPPHDASPPVAESAEPPAPPAASAPPSTPELPPDQDRWMRSLQLLQEARELCESSGVDFAMDMTFQDFLAKIGEALATQRGKDR